MSQLRIPDLKLVKIIEPKLNVNEKKMYTFISGLSHIRYVQYTVNSVSSSALQATITPSQNVKIDRQLKVKYDLYLQFTGTSTSGNNLLNVGLDDAVRFMPLQSSCSNIELQINGSSVSVPNPNQCVNALARFWPDEDLNKDFSKGFGMPDAYGFANYTDYATYGTARNVLANYGENSSVQPRGCTALYNIVSNTPTSAVVHVEITEPIVASPALFGQREGPSFALVQNLQVNMQFNLARVWSHSTNNGTQITAITSTISQNDGASISPIILYQEITTDPANPSAVSLYEKSYNYPFQQLSFNSQDYNSSVASGASASANSGTYQYISVPSAIYIYVQQKLSDKQNAASPGYFATNSTDTFARLNSLSVALNGQANLLSEASPEQLYDISRQNGINASWASWSQHGGSVLMLRPGADLPLDPLAAPGVVTQFTLQLSNVNFTNLSDVTMNFTLCVLAILDSVITITRNTMQVTSGVLSTEQVVGLSPIGGLPSLPVYGAGFFDSFAKGFKSVLGPALAIGEQLLPPNLRPVAGIAKNLLGVGGARARSRASEAKKRSKLKLKMYGGMVEDDNVGYLDRNDLEDRIEEGNPELEDDNYPY